MDPSGDNCPAPPVAFGPTPFFKIDGDGTWACFAVDGDGVCGECVRVGDQGALFEKSGYPNPWQTCALDPFSFIDQTRPQQYWRFDEDPETSIVHYRYYTDAECTIPDLTHALDDPYKTGPCVPMKDCTFEPKCFCLSHLLSFLS